jgi:multisubunit Na+/H+ antiporter MnhE subunit
MPTIAYISLGFIFKAWIKYFIAFLEYPDSKRRLPIKIIAIINYGLIFKHHFK